MAVDEATPAAAEAEPVSEPTITFTFLDDTTVESTFTPPYSVREQLDFEEHFRISFYAVEAAGEYSSRITEAKDGEAVDAGQVMRMGWILWFGWHRARARQQVASSFAKFQDTLKDYAVTAPPKPAEEEVDEAAADAGPDSENGEASEVAPALDPTVTEESSAQVP